MKSLHSFLLLKRLPSNCGDQQTSSSCWSFQGSALALSSDSQLSECLLRKFSQSFGSSLCVLQFFVFSRLGIGSLSLASLSHIAIQESRNNIIARSSMCDHNGLAWKTCPNHLTCTTFANRAFSMKTTSPKSINICPSNWRRHYLRCNVLLRCCRSCKLATRIGGRQASLLHIVICHILLSCLLPARKSRWSSLT